MTEDRLGPARRRAPVARRTAAHEVPDYDAAEVARGTTEAVLAALTRLQLKVDLLTRRQDQLLDLVEELAARIPAPVEPEPVVEAPPPPPPAPDPSAESAEEVDEPDGDVRRSWWRST